MVSHEPLLPERSEISDRLMLEHALNSGALDMFDKSVVENIFAPNQDIAQGGKYHDALSGIMVNRTLDKDVLSGVGIDIGQDICEQVTAPKARILRYLNVMNKIDGLGLDVTGRDDYGGIVIGLGSYICMPIVSELSRSDSIDKLFDVIAASLAKVTLLGDEHEQTRYRFDTYRLGVLRQKCEFYRKARGVARKYEGIKPLDDAEYEALKEKATLLTAESMRQRKYGTKPAYIEASTGGSWIFYDGEDWARELTRGLRRSARDQYQNVAAVVEYSPYTKFRTLAVKRGVDKLGNMYRTDELATKIEFTLYIGKDGAISIDPDGLLEIGLELNLSHTEELALMAEIVSNFYDLSMPVIKNRPDEKIFSDVVDRRKKNFDPIQRLLIPRVKYIETSDEYYASDDVTRTVREHDVTWFVRVLPNGWHASPEAAIEADAHGIELADNETFVKAHMRGSKNKVLGYHAIRHS